MQINKPHHIRWLLTLDILIFCINVTYFVNLNKYENNKIARKNSKKGVKMCPLMSRIILLQFNYSFFCFCCCKRQKITVKYKTSVTFWMLLGKNPWNRKRCLTFCQTFRYCAMAFSRHSEPKWPFLYLFSNNYDLLCESYSIKFNWLYDKKHCKCRNDTIPLINFI